jgi:hypothetical protein
VLEVEPAVRVHEAEPAMWMEEVEELAEANNGGARTVYGSGRQG